MLDRAQTGGRTPIVILGLAGLSMHHGALGATRSAGRLGIPVFFLQPGSRSPIGRSRYSCGCGGGTLPPEPGTDPAGILEVLSGLARKLGRALLLAVDDMSAMFVDDHLDVLRDVFLLPDQPAGLARALADKRSMYELCREHKIPTPAAVFPSCEMDVREQAQSTEFPVVLKRIDASQPIASTAPTTPNVLVAHDRDGLLAAYRAMESTRAPNVMLQEYVPDAPDANWMFNGYFDAQAACRASFTGRKLRQAPPAAGATTLGVCESNPTLARVAVGFLCSVGYRGIVDADYRYDQRDGQYKLLDVNPRIGASFRLFVSSEGGDVLRAQYRDLTGEPLPSVAQQQGRRWLVEPQDLRTSAIHIRRGDLSVGGWLSSLRAVQETAWWARDDPWPFLAMLGSLLAGRLRKVLGRGRSMRGTASPTYADAAKRCTR